MTQEQPPESVHALAIDSLRERMPEGVTGHIGVTDADLLFRLIEQIKPTQIIEIGTASGVSTAMIADAIHRFSQPLPTDIPWVISIDLHPFCYFDRTKPVGYAVQAMVPQIASWVAVHTGKTAADASELAAAPVKLAFIDADHSHPAPAEDLLALLPALAPTATVAFHDIALPEIADIRFRKTGIRPFYADDDGVQRLFNAWPFEKQRSIANGVKPPNCGALTLPGDHEEVRAWLTEYLAQAAPEIGTPSDRSPVS